MAALDLLGRRWALRVLWELRDSPVGARDLRRRCDGMSSSVLYERLRELTAAGLIARQRDQYALTAQGRTLENAIAGLDTWAQAWSPDPDHDEQALSPQNDQIKINGRSTQGSDLAGGSEP